jgi:hypothetical protein
MENLLRDLESYQPIKAPALLGRKSEDELYSNCEEEFLKQDLFYNPDINAIYDIKSINIIYDDDVDDDAIDNSTLGIPASIGGGDIVKKDDTTAKCRVVDSDISIISKPIYDDSKNDKGDVLENWSGYLDLYNPNIDSDGSLEDVSGEEVGEDRKERPNPNPQPYHPPEMQDLSDDEEDSNLVHDGIGDFAFSKREENHFSTGTETAHLAPRDALMEVEFSSSDDDERRTTEKGKLNLILTDL